MPEESEQDKLDKFVIRERSKFDQMCPTDQSPVLSVLRVHLLTEYYMERIFHLTLSRGDKLSDINLSYAQKIGLLESLGLVDDRTIQCLKNLNTVRNRCAHEYDKTISFADIELIGHSLGREYTEIHKECADTLNICLIEILSLICRNMIAEIYALEYETPAEENQENG